MKNRLLIISFLFLAIALILFWQKKESDLAQIGKQKIKIEVVKTQADAIRGLSGRESLCSNCGMLFLLQRSDRQVFWMKEMQFDLDFVWLDSDRVVKLNENVSHLKGEGEKIIPGVMADKVLEINAGKISEWGIKIGDQISF